MATANNPYGSPANATTHDIKDRATGEFDKLAVRASDTFRDAATHAEAIANRVAEQGRDAGDKVQEVAGNLKGAVDKSVKDQPMATLAIAAVLGFVLGAVWKS